MKLDEEGLLRKLLKNEVFSKKDVNFERWDNFKDKQKNFLSMTICHTGIELKIWVINLGRGGEKGIEIFLMYLINK